MNEEARVFNLFGFYKHLEYIRSREPVTEANYVIDSGYYPVMSNGYMLIGERM